MNTSFHILAALALDMLLGDPRWLPHPVRGMGWLAQRMKKVADTLCPGPRSAGVCVAAGVVLCSGALAYGVVRAAAMVHPWAADAVTIWLIYSTVALRDMQKHSSAVYDALAAGDMDDARTRVGLMVGRDTDHLDEPGVARAGVESVAEGIVDGVTAPLFYAFLAGPVGAVAYRAVNTLDSMFGYRHGEYRVFGAASARLDDIANYLPARVTAPLVCAAGGLMRMRFTGAVRMLVRDGRKHSSPNAGLCEAAAAGALGVQLGGLNYYFGEPDPKPTLGEPLEELNAEHLRRANMLAMATTGLFVACCVAVHQALIALW